MAEIEERAVTEKAPVRKKKKRRKKHYFLRMVVTLAIIVGIIYLLNSPLFDVQKIQVEGNSYFTSEQVIERSGLKTGVNVFFGVDKKDMKKALLADPYVKNITVERSLPDTVIIKLEERQEAAAIPFSNQYIITDADGLVLRTTEVEPALTLLVGLTVKNMDPGQALDVEENASLNNILQMVRSMQKSEVYFKRIDISKVMVRAYVYDSLVCQGMPEDIQTAVEDGTLQSLLYNLYSQGIEVGTITITADTTNMAYSPIYEPPVVQYNVPTATPAGDENATDGGIDENPHDDENKEILE